jgi:hypothetical protein
MKISRLIVLILSGLAVIVSLAGCIISASPNPNQVIEMKPGDKVIFKVVGPVKIPTTRCVWSIRNDYNYEVVSVGKNEFELDFNADSPLSNKKNIITCEYQTYQFENYGCPVCFGWFWETTDSRKWEVRTSQNSAAVITGDYIIENDSDLQLLKGYTTVTGSLIIREDIENIDGLDELTAIGGDLYISNPHIKDLTGLKSITSIGGSINIENNNSLTNLSGLENITSIGGSLIIYSYEWGNAALASLSGLDNVSSIGKDLWIYGNPVLRSLTGLGNVTSVGGKLTILGNDALTNLADLGNLTSLGGNLTIFGNDALTSLAGLEKITSVNGNLEIEWNKTLTSLSGTGNLASIGGDLDIYNNPALESLGMTCLQKIFGEFNISDNLLLCRSLAEELMNQVLAGGGIGGMRNIEGNKDCTTP